MTAPLQPTTGATAASVDGLRDRVAAVEAAREKLGTDLDVLNAEVRAQVGKTVEKTAWKLAGLLAAALSGVIARKLLSAGWRAAKKADPPVNPASRTTTWADALAWAAASGVAMGVGRLVAMRGAAASWEKATGTLPPGLEEIT